MLEKVTTILKCVLIPALIVVALHSCMAGHYESWLDLTLCMSAFVFVPRPPWLKEYGRSAVWAVAVVGFSPLFLVTKTFLLMGLPCFAACLMIVTAVRPQPVATF